MAEIDMRFNTMVRMADQSYVRYVVKNVARKNGLTATFMPAAVRGQRLEGRLPPVDLEGRKPLFAGDG